MLKPVDFLLDLLNSLFVFFNCDVFLCLLYFFLADFWSGALFFLSRGSFLPTSYM